VLPVSSAAVTACLPPHHLCLPAWIAFARGAPYIVAFVSTDATAGGRTRRCQLHTTLLALHAAIPPSILLLRLPIPCTRQVPRLNCSSHFSSACVRLGSPSRSLFFTTTCYERPPGGFAQVRRAAARDGFLPALIHPTTTCIPPPACCGPLR